MKVIKDFSVEAKKHVTHVFIEYLNIWSLCAPWEGGVSGVGRGGFTG